MERLVKYTRDEDISSPKLDKVAGEMGGVVALIERISRAS